MSRSRTGWIAAGFVAVVCVVAVLVVELSGAGGGDATPASGAGAASTDDAAALGASDASDLNGGGAPADDALDGSPAGGGGGEGADGGRFVPQESVGDSSLFLAATPTPPTPPVPPAAPAPEAAPAPAASAQPTGRPSQGTSGGPSGGASAGPTTAPTEEPTKEPTDPPTPQPTASPSGPPTKSPTASPTDPPTPQPTEGPTHSPTRNPTSRPTLRPTMNPTRSPTRQPSTDPTLSPTPRPTSRPVTRRPTSAPTARWAGEVAAGRSNPFRFFARIGEDFFDDETDLEVSGIDVAPDGSHLVLVSDEGQMIFLNLKDYTSGHCFVNDVRGLDGDDLEGVAIDPSVWTPNQKHVYIIHEGNGDKNNEPMLYKVRYNYNPVRGSCSARVVSEVGLGGAIPCLRTDNGIESLGLKRASRNGEPAVFFVGVQDTGKVYEVTSEGESHSSRCYDGGLRGDDVSGASMYNSEHGHLWSYAEGKNSIAVVDTDRDCTVAKYEIGTRLDEEGLAIDWERGMLYLAVDGQGDGSVVSAYNFTYPGGIDECINSGGSCGGFRTCGDKRQGNLFG